MNFKIINNEFNKLIWQRFLDIKSIILLLVVLGNIFYLIKPYAGVKDLVNYAIIIAVILSVPFIGWGTRIICLGLFILGTYLIITAGAGWEYCVKAMGKNADLVALLIVVPLLGVSLKLGDYLYVLDAIVPKFMLKRYQMYWVPTLLSHVLGMLMSVGAIAFTYEITARGKVRYYTDVLTKSISRGFVATLLWSPNMISTALVLKNLNLPWSKYALSGVLFAAISLCLGYFIEQAKGKYNSEQKMTTETEMHAVDKVKLMQLFLYVFIFLLIITLIELKTNISVIKAIPIVALILPTVWLCLIGKKSTIKNGYLEYFRSKANKYDVEVVLFVAAGFFSSALILSGWSEKLCHYIIEYFGYSTILITLVIFATVLLTSLVGIHPMVSVSTLAASLDASTLGFNPALLALVLIGSWSAGIIVSPLSGTNLILSGLTKKTPVEVAYANFFYAVILLTTLMAYVLIMHYWIHAYS